MFKDGACLLRVARFNEQSCIFNLGLGDILAVWEKFKEFLKFTFRLSPVTKPEIGDSHQVEGIVNILRVWIKFEYFGAFFDDFLVFFSLLWRDSFVFPVASFCLVKVFFCVVICVEIGAARGEKEK